MVAKANGREGWFIPKECTSPGANLHLGACEETAVAADTDLMPASGGLVTVVSNLQKQAERRVPRALLWLRSRVPPAIGISPRPLGVSEMSPFDSLWCDSERPQR